MTPLLFFVKSILFDTKLNYLHINTQVKLFCDNKTSEVICAKVFHYFIFMFASRLTLGSGTLKLLKSCL